MATVFTTPRCALALGLASLAAACSDEAPPAPAPSALSTALRPRQTPAYYVAQSELYFDTLDTRADPTRVPNYSALVARWEWPPWYLLTGYEHDGMIAQTRAALVVEPSTVPTRECRAFTVQPFGRCHVVFRYARGDCPIYEEFTFNDRGETTFIEAWSEQPGMLPYEDPADRWAEGPRVHRLSTRVPGLGNAEGLIDPNAPWMLDAARLDPEVADFAERTRHFLSSWAQAYRDAGPEAFARGCGWSTQGAP